MNPAEYTPDAICLALGISVFAEPWKRGLPAQQLRLLFAPSFNKEVCITLSEPEAGSLNVGVATARAQFWQQGFDAGYDNESFVVSTVTFEKFALMLRECLPVTPRGGIILDGIPTHLAYRSLQSQISVRINPLPTEPYAKFLAEIRDLALSLATNSDVRSALTSAWYAPNQGD